MNKLLLNRNEHTYIKHNNESIDKPNVMLLYSDIFGKNIFYTIFFI